MEKRLERIIEERKRIAMDREYFYKAGCIAHWLGKQGYTTGVSTLRSGRLEFLAVSIRED